MSQKSPFVAMLLHDFRGVKPFEPKPLDPLGAAHFFVAAAISFLIRARKVNTKR